MWSTVSMAATTKTQTSLTITLADGTEHTFKVAHMPKHWKSWLMQQLPYGTDKQGCTFSRKVI